MERRTTGLILAGFAFFFWTGFTDPFAGLGDDAVLVAGATATIGALALIVVGTILSRDGSIDSSSGKLIRGVGYPILLLAVILLSDAYRRNAPDPCAAHEGAARQDCFQDLQREAWDREAERDPFG